MVTQIRLAANRANAALSTGPVTDAGKLASSRNSLAHGLTAKEVVLPGEDQAAYDEFRNSLIADYAPSNIEESLLVDRFAESAWRYRRALRMETAFLTNRIHAIQAEHPELDPDQAAIMLFTDEAEQKRFRLFMRYFSAAERAYNKAFTNLTRILSPRADHEDPPPSQSFPAVPPPLGFVSQTVAPAPAAAVCPPVTSPHSPRNIK